MRRPKPAAAIDELTTDECFRLIDQIAEVNKGCLLVITGGEPLVRPDILDIARHAVKLGFMVVFGTNGMLINDRMAKQLVEIGVMGVGISIDSLDPQKHNTFRGVPEHGKAPWPASRPASETDCSFRCTSAPSR